MFEPHPCPSTQSAPGAASPVSPRPSLRRRFKHARRAVGLRLAQTLGPAFVRLISSTWRLERVGEDPGAGSGPRLLAIWHGNLLMGIGPHAHRGYAALISPAGDGRIAAAIAEGLGYRVVSGSTHRRAAQGALGLLRELRAGSTVVVTPDGPRGPRHRVQGGAVWLARRARAPLQAVALDVDRAWRLRSWDRFTVPKPFARITVRYGPAVVPGEDEPDEVVAQRLTDDLGAFGDRAEAPDFACSRA